MKTGHLFVYFLFLAFAVPSQTVAQTSEISSGQPLGCHGKTSELKKVKIVGRLLINKNFMPRDESASKRFLQESIELQLKHLMGFFKNSPGENLNAALSAFRAPINILKSDDTTYGSSFKIDEYLHRGLARAEYTQKAIARGYVKAEDEALLITYESSVVVADCNSKEWLSSPQIALPLDPYLSLWIEDNSTRQPRSFGQKKLDRVSNCSSNEIVLFGNSDVNWYFWSPLARKLCPQKITQVYRPDFKLESVIAKPQNLQKDFFKVSDHISFSATFGVISDDDLFFKNNISQIKSILVKNIEACRENQLIPECLSLWDNLLGPQGDKKFYEPGAYHLFAFLKYLNSLTRIDSFEILEIQKNSSDILLKMKAKLLDSAVPIEISIYYGHTSLDYGPRVSKTYIKHLYQSFKQADSMSYVGHAGLGENLKIENIQKLWKEEHLSHFERQKPLWLGIYNCEGFSYFGFDIEQLFKKNAFDLYLLESSGTEAGAKFPLAQLSILNSIFSKSSKQSVKSDGDIFANYVESSQFLVAMRLKNRQ